MAGERGLIFSVVGGGGAFLAAWLQEKSLEQARFRVIADEALGELQFRLEDYEQVLRSGVALLKVRPDVTRGEWHRFVLALDVGERYSGLQGIGLSLRDSPEGLLHHERETRKKGFPGYRVEPPGKRTEYFPIVYIEPFSGRNLRAFGFDMWSEPTRRAAMAAARAGGRAVLSGPVEPVQEIGVDVQRGVLLYEPFYAPKAGDRWDGLMGFVYSPLRMNDLLTALAADAQPSPVRKSSQACPQPEIGNRCLLGPKQSLWYRSRRDQWCPGTLRG